MALGEYASVETQNSSTRSEIEKERAELAGNPDAELSELAEMYRAMGLSRDTAERAAEEIHENPEAAVRAHATQELGVDPDEQPSPVTAAVSSFLCFTAGAALPLISFVAGVRLDE
jgi:VIT1/CCC1 family predicted Fe2+/Mn2+ transporter